MNKEMAKNYIGATIDNIKDGHFRCALYGIYRFAYFACRVIRYQIITSTRCPQCKSKMHVYFLRSSATVGDGSNECHLYDWFICQNETCDYKERFIGIKEFNELWS